MSSHGYVDHYRGTIIGGVTRVDNEISAGELERLLHQVPDGTTVELAAGEYVFDDTIEVNRSHVSLVGAGSDSTTLRFSSQALAGEPTHGLLFQGRGTATAGPIREDAGQGTNQVVIDEGHRISEGDTVRIWQENDPEYFEQIGNTTWEGTSGSPLRTSMAQVESVEDGVLTLDRGVHFSFQADQARVQRYSTIKDVSLEGVALEYPLGTPDPGAFSNELPELERYRAVEFDGTVGAHLEDINVVDGPSLAFEFSRSLDMTAQNLSAEGAFNKGSGGNGYAYEFRESYNGEFAGLEDNGMRHSVLFASWRSSVGNDIQVVHTDRDINFHGGSDHDNRVLIEQSIRNPNTDFMSPSFWINRGGEAFGAPTDPEANEVAFQYVIGTRRSDTVPGADNGVYLDGALGNDTLLGGAGDDILRGGRGNDFLEGSGGSDDAFLDSPFADYKVQTMSDGRVFVDGQSDDAILSDVDRAVFADGTHLDLATGELSQGPVPHVPDPEQYGQQKAVSAPQAMGIESFALTPEEESVQPQGVSIQPQAEEASTLQEDPNDTSSEELSVSERLESAEGGLSVLSEQAEVTSRIMSEWEGGYSAEVFVENDSEIAIDKPVLQFALPNEIETLWNGVVDKEGDRYSVSDDDPITLEPGETWRFAYRVREDGEALPADVQLIGEPQAPTPEPVEVTSQIVSSDEHGYTTEVVLENASASAIANPSLGFDLPVEIFDIDRGDATRDGQRYTIQSPEGSVLQPGETWQFKYRVQDDNEVLPTNAFVEGQAEPAVGSSERDESIIADGNAASELGPEIISAGPEEIEGGSFVGTDGEDYITGGPGSDRLIGLGGGDLLAGGGGADTFVFFSAADSLSEEHDTILDFDVQDGDLIDLTAIDADTTQEGIQNFTWRGDAAFGGEAGELRSADGWLAADLDGSGEADIQIEVLGTDTLSEQDVLLG